MGKVKVEVMPWLTTACGYKSPGNLLIEEDIKDGETIGEVLRRISPSHLPLAECLFDQTTQGIHGYISIALNNQLIPQLRAPGIRLKDGDTVRLFPTIDGG